MRNFIAPAPITPVILMGPDGTGGYIPTGAGGNQATAGTVTDTLVTDNATQVTVGVGQVAMVQNLQTTVLYVKKGLGASASVFSHVLSVCTAANDGLGGSVLIDRYQGVLTFFAATGSPRAIVSVN